MFSLVYYKQVQEAIPCYTTLFVYTRYFIFIQDKEKQNWEAAYQALRIKLEASENTCLRSEIELAKLKSTFSFTLFMHFVDLFI